MSSQFLNYIGMVMPTSSLNTKLFWGNGVSSTLVGGGVDDTFYVWSQGDNIVESPDAMATDVATIDGSYEYVLPANVENLTVNGTVSTVVGNDLSNLIIAQGSTSMTIDGDGGNDVIVANSGDDKIVTQPGYGHQVVYNFNPTSDVVRLSNFGIDSFSTVQKDMAQVGQDVVLTLDPSDSVIFRNTNIGELSANDFELNLDKTSSKLTFDDEFNTFSSSPSGSQGWMTTLPYPGLSARSGGGIEYYSDSSVGVNPFSDSNGVLSITAASATAGVQTPSGSGLTYTSGMMTTYKSFNQLYGYFEVRAQLPTGAGFWPAFWLLPANNTWPPELDVFEMLGKDPNTVFETAHSNVGGFNTTTHFNTYLPNASTGFNTYGVDWEKSAITWYINGVAVASMATPADMDTPMYMLLNLAVGGSSSLAGAATGASASMEVDYVRAYASGTGVSMISMASFLQDSAGLDGTAFGISDTKANILANLGAIEADAANVSSVTATDGTVVVSVATFAADQAALDLLNGGFEVVDSANNLASAFSQLTDAHITTIINLSNNPITTSLAQLTDDAATLAKIVNQSGSAVEFAVSDSAVNIENAIATLSSDAEVASISVSSGVTTFSIATDAAYQPILDRISGGFDISDTAGHETVALNSLGDSDIDAIVDTSNHAIGVSVSQLTADSATLAKLRYQNGSAYQLAVTDTATNIENGISTLADNEHVSAISVSGGTVEFSAAILASDQMTLNEIAGGFVITDTPPNLTSDFSGLQADLAHIQAVDLLGAGQPAVSVYQFGEWRGILDKIVGGFAMSDKATTIAAGANSLEADAAHITSISTTGGAPVVSTAAFLADQTVLNKVVGGVAVTDTAANIEKNLGALAAESAHLNSINLSGTAGQVFDLTSVQADADASALSKIVTPFTLDVTGANDVTDLTSYGNGLTMTAAGGTEVLTGGTSEVFNFNSDFGHAEITNFASYMESTSHDTISLPLAEFANFAALLADAKPSGSATLVTAANGDSLALDNVSFAMLKSAKSDFLFHT